MSNKQSLSQASFGQWEFDIGGSLVIRHWSLVIGHSRARSENNAKNTKRPAAGATDLLDQPIHTETGF
jgi:hypothetical protein